MIRIAAVLLFEVQLTAPATTIDTASGSSLIVDEPAAMILMIVAWLMLALVTFHQYRHAHEASR